VRVALSTCHSRGRPAEVGVPQVPVGRPGAPATGGRRPWSHPRRAVGRTRAPRGTSPAKRTRTRRGRSSSRGPPATSDRSWWR